MCLKLRSPAHRQAKLLINIVFIKTGQSHLIPIQDTYIGACGNEPYGQRSRLLRGIALHHNRMPLFGLIGSGRIRCKAAIPGIPKIQIQSSA